MSLIDTSSFTSENRISASRRLLLRLHIDFPLLVGLLLVALLGLVVLYSAADQDIDTVIRQGLRLLVGFIVLFAFAQLQPDTIRRWAPWIFVAGLLLLIVVLAFGEVSKGAKRWLNLGLFRFQPSELMKLAVPMMIAWYLSEASLPPRLGRLLIALVLVAVPTLLIARQPDLGTALLVASAGIFVLFLAGLRWSLILGALITLIASAPLVWNYVLHGYQQRRVLTLFNPHNDPLGAGYHIIQSTIAIGSGGLYGKGWLNGTQAHLDFIPERATDFIFAVFSEEFGFFGVLLLLALYGFIIFRGLSIAANAQDSFTRLLAGSITLTFLIYVFVNIGMVSGLLPVVGVPLPLVSFGGTSMVTLMAGFGILMSIHTHRRLISA